jgi:adenylate cyclase
MLSTSPHTNVMATPVPLPAAAFLFVDIVGFTSFTEEHGDARAADLAWRLRLGVEQQLGVEAHIVKTLGDAVMVRIADPGEAAAVGARIVARALPAGADPCVRVGVHYGPAVECDGDFFGATVNVAARVAALARPGEVLVTDALVLATRGRGARRCGILFDEIGERSLRNVARPVTLHAAVSDSTLTGTRRYSRRVLGPRAPARAAWALRGGRELAHV